MHLDAPTHPVDAPCWLDLASPEVKRAAAFYGELFGWSYRVDGPEYGNYHTALLESGTVAGIGQMQEGAPMPSAWTVYLHTHDVAAAVTSVTQSGAQVIAGPMEVPFQGHLAIVQDP